MATGKNLRTPIIKPRTQGGTFYTFASAMEDIGLNINDGTNIVKLSHYILLDIPTFGKNSGVWPLPTNGTYSASSVNVGDYIFAEYLQDAIFNMETTIRNDAGYNFAANKTVSERVFWKNLFKNKLLSSFTKNGDYYYEDPSDSYAKAFGVIASGSQRSDSFGIYNETFVQIPSSYGQMRLLFKAVNDENYASNKTYSTTNGTIIEGIQPSELSGTTLKSTGISAEAICDTTQKYTATSDKDVFEAVLDIDELREYYNNATLSYDDIGFGNVPGGSSMATNFSFNAILVYYTIYDSSGKNSIATNAYGIYILNNAVAAAGGSFYFPALSKIKTTPTVTGTSFSFRINIKPSSAFSGDITVTDNSTTAFSESEDFNEVIRNLSDGINILRRNAATLYAISERNQKIQNFAADAITKIDDFEKTINSIKLGTYFESAITESIYQKSLGTLPSQADTMSTEILSKCKTTFDSSSNITFNINTTGMSDQAKKLVDGMTKSVEGSNYYDLSKMFALLLEGYNVLKTKVDLIK